MHIWWSENRGKWNCGSRQELNPRVPRLSCHLSYDPSLLALNPDFPFWIFVWQLWRKIGRKAWDDFARDTVALWCHLVALVAVCVLLDASWSLCLVSFQTHTLTTAITRNICSVIITVVFFPVFVTSRPLYHVQNHPRLFLRFFSKAMRQNPEWKAWVWSYIIAQ